MQVADHFGMWAGYNNYDIGVGTNNETKFDANGNLLFINEGTNRNYKYFDATNLIKNTDGSANTVYSHDKNGNIIYSTPKSISLTYDSYFNLTSTTIDDEYNSIGSSIYDAANERVLKQFLLYDHTFKTFYFRGLSDYPLIEKNYEFSTLINTILYIYGPTGLVAIKDGSTVNYVLKDHLGSTRMVLNSSNQVDSKYNYSPFGRIMYSSVSTDVAYKFTSQEFDDENGLYNFRARMYDAELGMFYAYDPAMQNFSPFGYAGNNPVIRVDRNGRWFVVPLFLGAIMGEKIAREKGVTGFGLLGYIGASMAINVATAGLGMAFTGFTSTITAGSSAMISAGIGAGISGSLNDLAMSWLSGDKPNEFWRSFGAGFLGGSIKSIGGPFASFVGGGLAAGINSQEAYLQNALIGGLISVGDYYLEKTIRYNRKTGIPVLDENREEIDNAIREAHLEGNEAGSIFEGDQLKGKWKQSETITEGRKIRKEILLPPGTTQTIHSHTIPGGPSEVDLTQGLIDSPVIDCWNIYLINGGGYTNVGLSINYFMLNYSQINFWGRYFYRFK
ncbi:MAG: RHS repeat-associated core domain-containing protein [Ignavibacteria bacterium]|nr:RHS repeat-associated core domain-containing protein [Ignavibacteria bacterium]